ncbi:cation/H(+) antiporter 15 [Dioscorea cayenensis subsp. rotundata]|uniref:Cation/H(+) antiporter 15 n=1 Tax=Dioscorea cayennensis subsp. rotundata TaxID=55577 RepID=A0AB40AFT8_DIOCR|nr:cation/H(+) antiporter 15 [Dioscorea cayenensis subsp. rotundata]
MNIQDTNLNSTSKDGGGYMRSANSIICYAPTMITTNGIWMGAQPLEYSLPLFIFQLVIVVLTTRALVTILRPFRQPRVLAEILAGVVLGPTVFGRFPGFGETVFPMKSLLTLETAAHIGLLYFLFLVGVEMDVSVIRRMGRKALVIAIAGMIVPFAIGTSTSFIFRKQISNGLQQGPFLVFLGVALSMTAFPVLARILAEIKLLNTELGRIAMSAAIVNDIFAWVLLALAIALAETERMAYASFLVLLSGAVFVFFCFYFVRPLMWWIIRRIPEGESVDDFYVCSILIGVMLAGLVTDAIGIHAAFGAFVFGLVIPNGPLGATLIEKLEDFVTGLLLPLFFVISGLRTNLNQIQDPVALGLLVLVFLLASMGKVMGTIAVALFYSMPLREGLSLGFLMNTRGLVEMIILNIGRDKKVLDNSAFGALVLMSVLMTAIVTPVVTLVHKPVKRLVGYKRRNLQRAKPDAELRMVACLHNTRNVPMIISLLEASNPTKRSPIFIYALHLVELTGRSSAMLIVHNNSAAKNGRHLGPSHGSQAQSEHIIAAFENYEQHAGGVSVQTLTAVSPYSTMHEDICNLAEDKHVTLIVLPFHKQQTVDGGMEETNPAIRTVNQSVLANATCSVAILVDRGLSGTGRSTTGQHMSHHVALLFFGGPDDREALAYAWRMAEHPANSLTVVRFIPGEEAAMRRLSSTDSRVITIVTDTERERQMDDEYLNEFRLKNVNDETVIYMERVVNNSEETVAAIRSMDSIHDLYIVGRGAGEMASGMLAGMIEWMECPELGPVGDLLASSDFAATVSVLVVQQYVGGGTVGGEGGGVGEMGEQPVQQYLNNAHNRGRMVAGTHKGVAGSFSTPGNWDNGR